MEQAGLEQPGQAAGTSLFLGDLVPRHRAELLDPPEEPQQFTGPPHRLPAADRPGDHELHPGWVALLQAAGGDADDALARILAGIGWRVDGQPPPSYEARRWAAPTSAVLSLAGWNLGRYDDLRHDPRARRLARLDLRG